MVKTEKKRAEHFYINVLLLRHKRMKSNRISLSKHELFFF